MLERGESGDVFFADLVALGLELGDGGVNVVPFRNSSLLVKPRICTR
ncbi:hypothetical protein BX281_1523 [Streptomyces sp. Ag82_O1-15]|nr:hypothetical protein BX281_1523 [Streptomyces sp. Ag82_O1-15]